VPTFSPEMDRTVTKCELTNVPTPMVECALFLLQKFPRLSLVSGSDGVGGEVDFLVGGESTPFFRANIYLWLSVKVWCLLAC